MILVVYVGDPGVTVAELQPLADGDWLTDLVLEFVILVVYVGDPGVTVPELQPLADGD